MSSIFQGSVDKIKSLFIISIDSELIHAQLCAPNLHLFICVRHFPQQALSLIQRYKASGNPFCLLGFVGRPVIQEGGGNLRLGVRKGNVRF